jgi:D-serine deaminase-like pyridoxal phosphate-dependent protein
MTGQPQRLETDRLIGLKKSQVETPCLCLDLDQFESNIRHVVSEIRRAGKNWRPHAKCHKSPEIGHYLIEQGAIGLTCAKVSEAEVFADKGIGDLLIAHLPVGKTRVERLAALCHSGNPIATCDHYVQAESLSAECVRQSVTCRVLVDINIGMDRTGVRPGRDALELAKAVNRFPGLQLAGVFGYEGHVMSMTDPDQKARAIESALGILEQSREFFLDNGLCCDIVSAGGTGSLRHALQCEVLTEVQAGGAIFGDPFYTRMPDVEGYSPALTVLTTVVSRPSYTRAVLDAGRKAIAADHHPPQVKGWDDATIVRHSAEHLVLELGPDSREMRIGDHVELIVGYSDFTTMLHENYYCFRGDRLENIWPIAARGKLV